VEGFETVAVANDVAVARRVLEKIPKEHRPLVHKFRRCEQRPDQVAALLGVVAVEKSKYRGATGDAARQVQINAAQELRIRGWRRVRDVVVPHLAENEVVDIPSGGHVIGGTLLLRTGRSRIRRT